ncbi:MAG: aminoacyl-tRNA hydrolase [Candidatus Firestonebacteria bacterium]|nr:aminoacyl-tRNA hydrolase [Candidatus Firestonebacteria bacterium]
MIHRLIVGLGNPEPKYRITRHNIGFMIVSEYARKIGLDLKTKTCNSMIARTIIDGKTIILALPLTYMNNSGKAVKAIMYKYSITCEEILVINDDINLPFGKIRVRANGSHGGHNGLLSIIENLETDKFPRMRVGIGNALPCLDLKTYVLMNFLKEEINQIEKIIIPTSMEIIDTFIKYDITKTMNKFN